MEPRGFGVLGFWGFGRSEGSVSFFTGVGVPTWSLVGVLEVCLLFSSGLLGVL